ncbi:unnamed protein product [Linum tenue]|uniref:WIYLD domain-containing protein n=1 Tax=Linum tenue TaxID=586396 RepID=A0AAV0HMZ1_9ROSI|nr:unnamed protein product [Linum tenue]
MPPDPRLVEIFRTTRKMGYEGDVVKPVLKRLLKLYDIKIELIAEDNYRVLLDAILEEQQEASLEEDAQDEKPPLRSLKWLRPLRLRDREAMVSPSSGNYNPQTNGTLLKEPKQEDIDTHSTSSMQVPARDKRPLVLREKFMHIDPSLERKVPDPNASTIARDEPVIVSDSSDGDTSSVGDIVMTSREPQNNVDLRDHTIKSSSNLETAPSPLMEERVTNETYFDDLLRNSCASDVVCHAGTDGNSEAPSDSARNGRRLPSSSLKGSATTGSRLFEKVTPSVPLEPDASAEQLQRLPMKLWLTQEAHLRRRSRYQIHIIRLHHHHHLTTLHLRRPSTTTRWVLSLTTILAV